MPPHIRPEASPEAYGTDQKAKDEMRRFQEEYGLNWVDEFFGREEEAPKRTKKRRRAPTRKRKRSGRRRGRPTFR